MPFMRAADRESEAPVPPGSAASAKAETETKIHRDSLADLEAGGSHRARVQEAQLRLITGNTPVMLTRCSRDLRYLFVNRAYAEMLGRPVAEIEGKPMAEILGEKAFRLLEPHVAAVLDGHPVAFELELPLPDATRALSVNYVPEYDGGGRVVGWVASLQDINERKRSEAASQHLAAIPRMKDEGQSPAAGGRRAEAGTILLVEDNDDDVFVMKRALARGQLPHRLQVATDGQQALDYLSGAGAYGDRERFPLIIFLDLKLPYVHGFEVLSWMRQQPALQSIAVIVLTSSPEEKDQEKARALGARSYLIKPPTPDSLNRILISLGDAPDAARQGTERR